MEFSCNCVYSLCQAEICIKWLRPATRQDIKQSRWICLVVIIPTPTYPSSFSQPACLIAEYIKGRTVRLLVCPCAYLCTLILAGRQNGHKLVTVRKTCLSRILLAGCVSSSVLMLLSPCWSFCSVQVLCLFSSPARSPSGALSCLISWPDQHFACFSWKCLTFSGVLSHYSLWDPLFDKCFRCSVFDLRTVSLAFGTKGFTSSMKWWGFFFYKKHCAQSQYLPLSVVKMS